MKKKEPLLKKGPYCPECGTRMQDQRVSPFLICPKCGNKVDKKELEGGRGG